MNFVDILNKENQSENTVSHLSPSKLSPLRLNSPKKSTLKTNSKRKNSPLKKSTTSNRQYVSQKSLTPLSQRSQTSNKSSPLSPITKSQKNSITPRRTPHATSPVIKSESNINLPPVKRLSIDIFEGKVCARDPLLDDEYEVEYDAYGFRKDPELKHKVFFTSIESIPESHDFWNEWRNSKDDSELLNVICNKGIPHELRSKIWPSLLDIGMYKEQLEEKYSEIRNLGKHPIYSCQIELDLNRTYSNHIEFHSSEGRGQRALSNILNSYAHVNEKIGYCQGMSFIAGMNLMLMNEESSFWCLYAILKKCNIEEYFEPSMTGLIEDTEKLGNLLSIMNEKLYNHLKKLNIEFTIFASRWFLQLFTDLNDWETVLRIWDIIVYEGKDGIFRVSLGLLNAIADDLLRIENTEEIFPYILNIPASKIECNKFIPKLLDIDMKSLMSQYDELLRNKKISNSIISRKKQTPKTSFVRKIWSRISTPSKSVDKKIHATPFRMKKKLSPIGRSALNSITQIKSPNREFDEEKALKSLSTFTPSKDHLFLTPYKEQMRSSTKKRRVLSPVELAPLK